MNNSKKNNAIDTGNEVKKSKDPHIDQDFENFPHLPANKKTVTPSTKKEREQADTDHTDGEKMDKHQKKMAQENLEQDSDGSASAFEGTEKATDEIRNKDAKTVSD